MAKAKPSLSDQVAANAVALGAQSRALKAVGKRLDTFDLNGSIPALHALAYAAPGLLKLADASEALISYADPGRLAIMNRFFELAPGFFAQADLQSRLEIYRQERNNRLHKWLWPFRPLGAVVWSLIITATVGIVWRLVTR